MHKELARWTELVDCRLERLDYLASNACNTQNDEIIKRADLTGMVKTQAKQISHLTREVSGLWAFNTIVLIVLGFICAAYGVWRWLI